jgi:hypothetical protein
MSQFLRLLHRRQPEQEERSLERSRRPVTMLAERRQRNLLLSQRLDSALGQTLRQMLAVASPSDDDCPLEDCAAVSLWSCVFKKSRVKSS